MGFCCLWWMNSITDAHLGVRVTRAACAYTVLPRANQLQTAVGHLPGPPDLIYMYMYMYMYQYSCVMQTGMYMYMYTSPCTVPTTGFHLEGAGGQGGGH